jgi:hypothetical protein
MAITPGVRASQPAPSSMVYPEGSGPGAGRHVVFLTGDEEYRGEEGLPMLAKILSQRHGFRATVLFPLDPDGTINPNNQKSLPGSEAPGSGAGRTRHPPYDSGGGVAGLHPCFAPCHPECRVPR